MVVEARAPQTKARPSQGDSSDPIESSLLLETTELFIKSSSLLKRFDLQIR